MGSHGSCFGPHAGLLTGRHVHLEPLLPAHAADLERAGADPDVWPFIPCGPCREGAGIDELITECKLLLLEHAFEPLGGVRVQLKTDARNQRSQAVIARIGARQEVGPTVTSHLSSATFRKRGEGLEWVHVHETWLKPPE